MTLLDGVDLTFSSADGSAGSEVVPLFLLQYIIVTNVGTSGGDCNRHVKAGIVFDESVEVHLVCYVNHMNHHTCEDEVDFICLITLTEQKVVVKTLCLL